MKLTKEEALKGQFYYKGIVVFSDTFESTAVETERYDNLKECAKALIGVANEEIDDFEGLQLTIKKYEVRNGKAKPIELHFVEYGKSYLVATKEYDSCLWSDL